MIREINQPNIDFTCYSGDLQIYDLASDEWKIITSQFQKRAYHNIHFYDDKLYVIGGKRLATNKRKEYLADKIEVYDTKNYTVKIDHTNPHQAVNFASVLYKDNLILLGGSTKLYDNGGKKILPKSSFIQYWNRLLVLSWTICHRKKKLQEF